MTQGRCFLCGECGYLERHHIFGGSNRKKSEKYGLVVDLCGEKCHRNGPRSAHMCKETADSLKRYGQMKFMRENNATEDDFRRLFGKNYL